MDETPRQRTARLVQAADRRIAEILNNYEGAKQTPQQQRAAEAESRGDLIESLVAGGVSAENVAAFQRDLDEIALIAAGTSSIPEDVKDEIIHWTFHHFALGQIIHITSETSRHWREATVRDEGKVVLFSDYGKAAEFGRFEQIVQIPNEDEDCVDEDMVAAIITQSGKTVQSGYASGTGIFENVLVVPDVILRGVNDEAPPGRFFSGRLIKRSSNSWLTSNILWSPAPEGKVWCDHPFLKNGPQYFTDFQHFCVKRTIEFGVNDQLDCAVAYRMYEGSMYGAMQYWCPVKRKFMTEGEMRREQNWFHNGNGSVQQQYFYSQNEMLDKHGGSASLPRSFDLHTLAASILTAASSANDELIITQVRSASQAIDHKFKEAEEQGKVMDLTQGA
jgi:hypothetical protein